MAARFQRFDSTDGTESSVVFDCPGCNSPHSFRVLGLKPLRKILYLSKKPVWGWNGDLVHATFSPSLHVEWEHGPNREPRKCHSFVVNGRIKFLDGCTHALAGQTVDVPEVEDGS